MRHLTLLNTLALIACPLTQANAQANAGPDQELCIDSTSLQANAPLPTDSAFWTVLNGSATFADASDPMTSVTGLDYTENILSWTLITALDTTSDQVSIFLYWADPAVPNAGPDQIVDAPPATTIMNATQPVFPQICSWTVVAGTGSIVDPNDPNTYVTSLGPGANVFQWTCDNAPCNGPSSDQIVINVQMATPIGMDASGRPVAIWFDHSSAQLRTLGDAQVSSLSIVNAMGQVVAVLSHPTVGKIDMSNLPIGSYTATATIGGERRILRFVRID